MVRGILATCYARPAAGTAPRTGDVMAALHEAYDAEPFVVVTDDPPSTKATAGANAAHVTARVDPRTGWVVSFCALDNLATAGLPLPGIAARASTGPWGSAPAGASPASRPPRPTTSPSWPPPM